MVIRRDSQFDDFFLAKALKIIEEVRKDFLSQIKQLTFFSFFRRKQRRKETLQDFFLKTVRRWVSSHCRKKSF